MITEDKRFIKIQGTLAMSDVHPADCIKINDLIIELSKENQQLKDRIDKAIEYIEKDYSFAKRHDIPLLTKDEQLAGKLFEILKGEENE